MNVVIMQPFYLFLRKHFHQVYRADTYVFYDDVQFIKGGHHNRNRIKGPNGYEWLTVPILHRGRFGQMIKEANIDNTQMWRRQHWGNIVRCYRKAPFFKQYCDFFCDCYEKEWTNLCDLNTYLITHISEMLGINWVRFVRSSELNIQNKNPTQRLIDICEHLGATSYIIGTRAKDYMEEDRWKKSKVTLEWFEPTYPSYPQLWGAYLDYCSIIDVLFNCGPDANDYIWGKKYQAFERGDNVQ